MSNFDYSNWYVLNVMSFRENLLKNSLDYIFKDKFKTLIFSKDIIHNKKNKKKILNVPLFPGYIFVYKNIYEVASCLKSIFQNDYIKPVIFDKKAAKVPENEMKRLLSSTNSNANFPLSTAIIKECKDVEIIKGPLKDLKAKILFFNKRKNKAKAEIQLFNRKTLISLGVDFIKNPTL